MSIAIEELAAELRKLPPDEWERLSERWNASQERGAVLMPASDTKMADRPSEIERGAV